MKNKSALIPGERTLSVEPHLEGKTLTIRVKMTRDLKRYFRKDQFFIRYEQDISADEGVLGVPAIALLLPLAWLTGSTLKIRRLDRAFAGAAEALRIAYSRIYPKISFDTSLIVEELVDSPPGPEGSAMLFSGGLDATHSFFANRHLKPRLIEVFGTEFPVSHEVFLNRVKKETAAFGERHGVEVSFVYTDFGFFYDQRALAHSFAPVCEKVGGDLWKGMGYALGFLSMTAPLSAGRFNHAIIAAWANQEHADRMRENPDSSSPGVDEKIAWSNLRVQHHGCLHRYEKVQEMRDWLPGIQLRVCLTWQKAAETEDAINCNRCQKCARTIVALAIGGVDPGQCGFRVDEGTINYIRNRLEERSSKNSQMAIWWGPMQRQIPENIQDDMFGLRAFMDWFRTFDLGNGIDPTPSFWSISSLYSRFPYPLALAIRSVIFAVLGETSWMNVPESRVEKKSRSKSS